MNYILSFTMTYPIFANSIQKWSKKHFILINLIGILEDPLGSLKFWKEK
jgi:hypothetical protein